MLSLLDYTAYCLYRLSEYDLCYPSYILNKNPEEFVRERICNCCQIGINYLYERIYMDRSLYCENIGNWFILYMLQPKSIYKFSILCILDTRAVSGSKAWL